MAPKRTHQLFDLDIEKFSGVDDPAHLEPGYALFKSAASGDPAAVAALMGVGDGVADVDRFLSALAKAAADTTFDAADRTGIADLVVRAMDAVTKAQWSTEQVNDLPDASFAYIEPGGAKDDDGKTAPRSKRHFPIKGADGNLDDAHVRNALSRLDQSEHGDKARGAVEAAAKKLGIGQMAKSAADIAAVLDEIRKSLKEGPVPDDDLKAELAKAREQITTLQAELAKATKPPEPAEDPLAKAVKDNPALAELLKAKDDEIAKARTDATSALEKANEQEARVVEQTFTELAKSIGAPGQGPDLARAFAVSLEHGGEMERLYRQNAELAKQAGVFIERGSGADGDTSPKALLAKAVTDLRTAHPDLTQAEAVIKAVDANPDLRHALDTEDAA